MNAAGTIAFCTVASVIVVIAAIQCYRIWKQDKKLKKQRMKDTSSNEVDNTNNNTTADLEGGGKDQGGGLTEPGETQSGAQLGRSLDLYPSPAWAAGSGTRPGSGYDGLEVVPSAPDMVQRKDFAIAASTPETQQRAGGSSWTGSWAEFANSIANFDNTSGKAAVVPEQKHHQAPTSQHQSQGLLQPSSMALPSRSISPVSAVHDPAQFQLGRSTQHQNQRNESSISIHSLNSTAELATPSPVVYRPYNQLAGGDVHHRAPSTSPEPFGGRMKAQAGDSQIPELESPMQAGSTCSTPSQADAQPPYRPYSEAQAHNRHLSTESHKYRAYHAGVHGSKEPQLLPRPPAPLHSHSTSLPVTGKQQVTVSNRTDSDQPQNEHQKSGRFSLNSLTVALPKGKRWSWNPKDDAAFSGKVRVADA